MAISNRQAWANAGVRTPEEDGMTGLRPAGLVIMRAMLGAVAVAVVASVGFALSETAPA